MDSPAHISIMHVERQKPFFANTTITQMEKKAIHNAPGFAACGWL
jgi:hypothetical protein